jgi:NAD(P)H-hydrate repair Nnr-like enzyme with NAD(P)H-hydrate epimerase domain
MRAAHTAAQVRDAEAALMALLPGGALMQRAAAGLAVACARRLDAVYAARVALLVGSGNNGADALWAGARLAARGAHVVAVTAGEPVADALAAFRAAGGRLGDATALEGADLVVDGLVGIGGSGALRPAAAALAEAVRARVVAVDVRARVSRRHRRGGGAGGRVTRRHLAIGGRRAGCYAEGSCRTSARYQPRST